MKIPAAVLGISLITLFLLGGCDASSAKPDAPAPTFDISVPSPSDSPSPSALPEPSPPPELKDISFDDQKQVAQLIADYFAALETKNDAAAWNLLSPGQQEAYPLDEAMKNHFGFDDVKLVSMKGILPPRIAKTVPPYEFKVAEVPDGTPTVWFEVQLDITPSPGSAWDKGINTRFVTPVKDSDGNWRIDGLTTSP